MHGEATSADKRGQHRPIDWVVLASADPVGARREGRTIVAFRPGPAQGPQRTRSAPLPKSRSKALGPFTKGCQRSHFRDSGSFLWEEIRSVSDADAA